jgi:hypothetical protein
MNGPLNPGNVAVTSNVAAHPAERHRHVERHPASQARSTLSLSGDAVASRDVGDAIPRSRLTRRVDSDLFGVMLLKNYALIHEPLAMVASRDALRCSNIPPARTVRRPA